MTRAATTQVPPRGRPRREDVREALLDAALEAFSALGYERTSLGRVAAGAGFTKGAVYSNFGSKDELFLAVLDRQVQRRVEEVREALRAPHDRARGGRLVGDRLTRALDEDRAWQLLLLDYVLRAARDPDVAQRFAVHRRRIRAVVAEAVRELVAPLPDPATGFDAAEVATAVLALANGLALERVVDPQGVPDDLLGRLLQALQPPGTSVG